MQIRIRNLSTTFADKIEIYLLDPASTEPTPVLPTYSFTPPFNDTTAVLYDWPRTPANNDVIPFFAATNNGSGPANVASHTPSGASITDVRLRDDGSGGFVFQFIS